MNKKNFWQIFIILLVSIFIIFYQFPNIPQYLAFDEVEFTKLALSLENKPYTPYSPLATGHSTLYFYILLFFLKTFGINSFSLRLPAAISGVLSSVLLYLIFKLIYKNHKNIFIKNYLPFFLTLIFISLRWFFNFARFAFEGSFLLFLELTAIYFLLKYIKKQKNIFLILLGIFTGLPFNSYTPGRIFFIIPLMFLLYDFFKNKKIYLLKNFLFFLIPFLILITPLNIYFIYHQDNRIDKLFFWRNHELTLQKKIEGTIQNISSLTLMLFLKGDINGKHNYPGKPALNPLIFSFFLFGLIYSFLKNRSYYFWLFFIYLTISIIPSIPIYPWENPNMLRTYTILPSIIYFISQAIIFLINKFKKNNYIFLIILIPFIFSSIYEIRTYFKYQKEVFKNAFEYKDPLDKIIKLKL